MDYDILIVDDEERIRRSLSRILTRKGYAARTVPSAESALVEIEHKLPDLVLLDMSLPGMNGLEALEQIKHKSPQVIVIIITAYGTVESAVSAMKLGSYDFVNKPLDIGGLNELIEKALETKKLRKEVESLRSELTKRYKVNYIIGTSERIQAVYRLIEKIPPYTRPNVLIEGASGTGKELVAFQIHRHSNHRESPFLTVNCGAIPKDLMESELFGYEPGAFTDAKRQGKRGIFEEAEEGTVFLDEVAALSPELQVKLLRALENREFYKVGGLRPIPLKAQVVAATNKNLKEALRDGSFRPDLYYRLNVVNIQMSLLKERREDIIPLAKSFIAEFSAEFQKNVQGMSPEVERIFLQYPWPGNVRQLRNLIERIVLLEGPDIIRRKHLPDEMFERKPRESETTNLTELEQRSLLSALESTNWNLTRTARLLGIGRGALRYRIRKHGIEKKAVSR